MGFMERSRTFTVNIIVVLGVIWPFYASADDKSWYIGVSGFGSVTVDRTVSHFDDGSIISGRVDENDSGWKIFGGYFINKYFAFELGRADLNNDPDSETSFTGFSNGMGDQFGSGAVSIDVDEPTAFYLAMVGRLPLPLGSEPYHDRLSLIGKLGVTSWKATYTEIDSNGQTEMGKGGTDLTTGIALEYQWENGVAIRTEWEFFRDIVEEDYQMLSIGIKYGF